MAQVQLAANGIGVDIDRPYYDADRTVIQDELPVVEFEGGFGTFEGGQAYVRAFGSAAFERAVDSVEAALVTGLGLGKDEASWRWERWLSARPLSFPASQGDTAHADRRRQFLTALAAVDQSQLKA